MKVIRDRVGWYTIIFTLLILLNSGCDFGEETIETTESGDQKTTGVLYTPISTTAASTTTQEPVNLLKFNTYKYIDTKGIGIEAFSLLVPSDWEAEADIAWVLDNPGMPASLYLHVWNPEGKEEYTVYPAQSFFWSDNPMVSSMFPTGSKYFGMEVLEPVSAETALTEIVMPRMKSGIGDYEITKSESLENTADTTQDANGITTSSEGWVMRIEYRENGAQMEEEVWCLVNSATFPIQSLWGTTWSTTWYVDYISSFKAEKGKLDESGMEFEAMSKSLKLNPLWYSKYNQVIEYLVAQQIERIQSVGELSRIISQTNDEISDMIMDSYNNRQATEDRIYDNFSQYMRGVDEYYDPVGQQAVELPSGYENAWVNNLGEYILSDSASYNPNIGSNQNWQQMEK